MPGGDTINIIGIVGEYNPFHLGHFHHLSMTKKYLGEDSLVICAMSGDFVQRGEAAMYSKFARAEAACVSGVDLVVELPLPWALSSAEGFARGAVELLGNLGITHLSFGSELGELEPLSELADILLGDGIYNEVKVIQRNDGTLSFAAARELAVEKIAGEKAGLLKSPNNILAIEYIKAIKSLEPPIEAFTIARIGNAHDGSGDEGPRSASELRNMRRRGEIISPFVPEMAANVYLREQRQGREVSGEDRMELAMMSRLRMLDRECFNSIPDAADGLGDRIYSALREASSLEELYSAAKTKRYALSRVRRACLCAALGIYTGMNDMKVPYARVLAANAKGCGYLRSVSANSAIPVITKPAHVNELSSDCMEVFALGAKAHDLYVLCYEQKEARKASQDWRTSPFIVKN